MRARHLLLVCLLFGVGTAFADTPATPIDTLADAIGLPAPGPVFIADDEDIDGASRSEEHTSKLQSLMRISYAVFCLKKKNKTYKLNIYYSKLHVNTPKNIRLRHKNT